MTADQTVLPPDSPAPGEHWALRQLLDRDRDRCRHTAVEAIPLDRLAARIIRSTSPEDLAERLGVGLDVLAARLRTLDDEETWQLTARVAFTDTTGDDRG